MDAPALGLYLNAAVVLWAARVDLAYIIYSAQLVT